MKIGLCLMSGGSSNCYLTLGLVWIYPSARPPVKEITLLMCHQNLVELCQNPRLDHMNKNCSNFLISAG